MIVRKSDLKLVKTDDLVLNTAPEPFDFEKDGDDAELLANVLVERMKELGGVGLSANQVGLNTRVFVMGVEDWTIACFNPEIVETIDASTMDEGCLSFPGVYLKVTRPREVVVTFQNVKGERVSQRLTGLTARIFLHEYDHMEGKTFKNRVSKIKWDLAYNRMIKRTKKIIRRGVQQQLVNIAKEMEGQN